MRGDLIDGVGGRLVEGIDSTEWGGEGFGTTTRSESTGSTAGVAAVGLTISGSKAAVCSGSGKATFSTAFTGSAASSRTIFTADALTLAVGFVESTW